MFGYAFRVHRADLNTISCYSAALRDSHSRESIYFQILKRTNIRIQISSFIWPNKLKILILNMKFVPVFLPGSSAAVVCCSLWGFFIL